MAKALFELNPNLDRAALAQRFAADTRLQVENILTDETARELREILISGTEWGVAIQAGTHGQPHSWRGRELRDPATGQQVMDLVKETDRAAAARIHRGILWASAITVIPPAVWLATQGDLAALLTLGLVLFGQKPNLVALGAGLLGFAGIGLMFWPKLAGAEFNGQAALGLAYCVGGTLSFCLGNMLSADTQRRGIGVTPATAWGMVYGMAFLGLFSALAGREFVIDWSVSYLGGLVYLAVVASVIAFASYLTLLGRIGSARAGYATVMFPVVALSLSTIFEGYQWTPLAAAGLVCVLGGNLMMLRAR